MMNDGCLRGRTMFIENCWYVAAWVGDIAQDQLFAISIIGEAKV